MFCFFVLLINQVLFNIVCVAFLSLCLLPNRCQKGDMNHLEEVIDTLIEKT